MSGFKAGDRVVRGERGTEGVIVGRDQRPTHPDRWVVWTPKDDADSVFGEWTSWAEGQITLIPDTVTVTVELPRDEAEAIAAVGEEIGRAFESEGVPRIRGYAKFRSACSEALS